MGETSIEWTDVTWNPVTGCTKISPGCKNCYAERVFPRTVAKQCVCGHSLHGAGLCVANALGVECECSNPRQRQFTDVMTHSGRLGEPLHWKKPRMVFVNSMSDLFHESILPSFVKSAFDVMKTANQHIYQVLTKRPARMKELVTAWLEFHGRPVADLRHIWLGVSVEDRKRKERIDILRDTPAVVRFLSIEPLLEDIGTLDLTGIHWVIVGGESGPKARPMHPEWVRSIRDQCRTAGVAFFFKQWGEWTDLAHAGGNSWRHTKTVNGRRYGVVEDNSCDGSWRVGEFETQYSFPGTEFPDGPGPCMVRVGKKAAGRLLDGKEWSQYPGHAHE